MSILLHQRARIAAALRTIVRAAAGRDLSRPELNGRVSAYLDSTQPRGLGPSDTIPATAPIFRSSDYAPSTPQDPLGGSDGRDISRAYAAVREDLDTLDNVLTEAERRINQTTTLLRSHTQLLQGRLETAQSEATALTSQLTSLFFGGGAGSSAGGQGRWVWNVTADTNLVAPQTTGIVLSSGLASLPTLGSAAIGASDGGAITRLRFLQSSDTSLQASTSAVAFIESPLGTSQAWSFTTASGAVATLTFQCESTSAVGALEIQGSPTLSITTLTVNGTSAAFSTVSAGSTLWLLPTTPIPAGATLTLALLGTVASDGSSSGSIQAVRAHIFSFNGHADLIYGPFASTADAGSNGLFAITLESTNQAVPQGGRVQYSVSTTSADGPWSSLPSVGSSIILGAPGSGDYTLLATDAQPDSQTQGFYQFPFTAAGSMAGAEFTAGVEQVCVQAYNFNWAFAGEVAHDVSPTDWTNPQGTPCTVAMGAGPNFQGDLAIQNFDSDLYTSQGTCLSRYQDINGADLNYISLRDKNNDFVLQQAYNYQFNFSLFTVSASYLSNVPVGIFNPNGNAGLYGVPILAQLNGQQVYRGYGTFSDYNEVSAAPSTFGTSPSDGTWPPNCGRMNLALRPGWNLFQVSVYIPSGDTRIDNNLDAWAGIIFGPSLFMDPATRFQLTGIQKMLGWQNPWTQLSEFDLRMNTPSGLTDVWAWTVDPSSQSITGLLINHNPAISETGYTQLDGVLTGQPRTHHISYLPQATNTTTLAPGQDPLSEQLWVRASLDTSNPETGPLVAGFSVSVN